ncbi:rab-GTPase-TBC domain-domain-containing protein [Clohesyomyces aquaticus]|uniref:Rab-GTPase-TBC domain-domain-containing protein n=1 Tax=Clohesyomyces aquaticus TaxID=1231657 RepID=A0A1Y2A0E7_9PLEO|nr:rab-GTPase-TBC domain-domain-containing protein [Clohesyomyces aquaticus]
MRDAAAGTPAGEQQQQQQQQQHHLSPATSNDASSSPSPAQSSSSPSPSTRGWLSSVRRPRTSPGPKASALKRTQLAEDDVRRDSALATSSSPTTSSGPSSDITHSSPPASSLRRTPSLPAIVVQDGHSLQSARPSSHVARASQEQQELKADRQDTFRGIDTIIPTGGFDDLVSPTQLSFSKRGSMIVGGKRANTMKRPLHHVAEGTTEAAPPAATPPRQKEKEQTTEHTPAQKEEGKPESQDKPESQELHTPQSLRLPPRSPSRVSARGRTASTRVLSTDEMMLSRKVRTMYKHGNEGAAEWESPDEDQDHTQPMLGDGSAAGTPLNGSSLTVDARRGDAASLRSARQERFIEKEPTETAGGVEDWADLEGDEVDRYGFIVPKKSGSRGSSNGGLSGPDEPRIQRVSTALKIASEEPRRRRIGRSASKARSARSANPSNASSPKRRRSLKSTRNNGSVYSNQTAATRTASGNPLRYAANRLPHNKDRRFMDEASDMLTLPPGLAQIAEQEDGGRAAQAMKAKEMEREEKWRKMARVVESGAKGGGMMFEFDVKDPKLVARTWKGIPDRWRGTAWYAFLAASAKADPESPTDEELIESYYELQEESSADDMQIDVDVPRTINRHIMFRRRYRGGQRLLFRVLHAMSLYLPDTGYVQGMAALAATLLCYYEEDKAFVMLVRLWMLRGLERLYESGFIGLMDALEDFEKNWLRGGDVAKKLEELCITSTAYGTRWYLTLFNYSLPFPAQLRVWDVFMLLGDKSNANKNPKTDNSASDKFSGDLDVLHATSAALIDATREILLDSDFENAMKVLTSWVPIKDEDLLMRVAKAEYKMRKKRARDG